MTKGAPAGRNLGRVASRRGAQSWRQKLVFSVLLGLMILTVTIGICEIVIRLVSPVETLRPRYKFSPEYGLVLFENTTMVHARPRKYKFHYSVNSHGHRGPPYEPRPSPGQKTIIVLGDSYSFGIGVDDGGEFASQMSHELGNGVRVVNLGNPGWGLTQEIRRYMEYGRLFEPDVVVLQYCGNDPEDNLGYMVTTLSDERGEAGFTFRTSARRFGWVKRYLSRSILQNSQTYNFFRNRVYEFFKNRVVRERESTMEAPSGSAETARERFYVDLLERFTEVLARDEVRLIMISVNGQLAQTPWLMEEVTALNDLGKLDYVEVEPWFEGESDYRSPEGHLWGARGHAILGRHLAEYIRRNAF